MKFIIRISIFILLLVTATGLFYLYNIGPWQQDRQGMLSTANRQLHNLLKIPLIGTPDLEKLEERLAQQGLKKGAPVFIRIFKKESVLELWLRKNSEFVLFATYPICRWSGRLGPKVRQGDHQAPEGFYTVSRSQLNPNSRFHLSFNLGYPNAYDKAHDRTGDFLMVHGNCVSAGCYAMTDAVITEIWDIINSAFRNGQKRFHVHAFPFHMTEFNLALNEGNRWVPFWKDLKTAYDIFERDRQPPQIGICDKRYVADQARPDSSDDAEFTRAC